MYLLVMEFLANYFSTIVVAMVLLVLLFFAVRSVYRNRHRSGCGGQCCGCPHGEACRRAEALANKDCTAEEVTTDLEKTEEEETE